MKKSIAVMLAAVMTLSMAACGSKKSDDTTAAAETTGATGDNSGSPGKHPRLKCRSM